MLVPLAVEVVPASASQALLPEGEELVLQADFAHALRHHTGHHAHSLVRRPQPMSYLQPARYRSEERYLRS